MIELRCYKRLLSFIMVLAMISCLVPTVAFADNTVDLFSGSYSDGDITVTTLKNNGGALMPVLNVGTDAGIGVNTLPPDNVLHLFGYTDTSYPVTFSALDASADAGDDVTVQFTVTAPGQKIAYFAFNVGWDADVLTYKSSELKGITVNTTAGFAEDTFVYRTFNDANGYETFDGTVILEMTFATPNEISGETLETAITVTKQSDEDDAYYDDNLDPIPSDNIGTANGTVTINKTDNSVHRAPKFDLAIDGSGAVGEVLNANISNFEDNFGLIPVYSYEWLINGIVVSQSDSYTPAENDSGKKITLKVTAAVEADENPTAERTAVITVPLSPGGAKVILSALDRSVKTGEDVTVQFTVSAPEQSVAYFAFDIGWDDDVLTYKSHELKTVTRDTTAEFKDLRDSFCYQSLNDSNADKEFDNTLILEVTFAAPGEIEGDSIETEISVSKWSVDDDAYYDGEFNSIPVESVATKNGKVTVVKKHKTPDFNLDISGSGVVLNDLTASITGFTDNFGLVPSYAYEWSVDGCVVSTQSVYTPVTDDIGKKVTLKVIAAVDSDENAEAEKTAEITVIPDVNAKASVSGLKFTSDSIIVGVPVSISYTFSPSVNGGEDASTIDWMDLLRRRLTGTVSADGKTYTPSEKDRENGILLGVRVWPKGTLDTSTGDSVDIFATEPVKSTLLNPDDITVMSADNVYLRRGYKLIKVVSPLDYTQTSITVGSQKLYYTADKNAFYGIVSSEGIGGKEITAEAIAGAAVKTDTPSDIFSFGKASNPSGKRDAAGKVTAGDVAAAKKMVLKTSTADVMAFIAADVNSAEPDGTVSAGDVAALKKNVLNKTVFPVLN